MCKNNLAYLTAQNWLKNKKKVDGGGGETPGAAFSVCRCWEKIALGQNQQY